ncbi:MAG: potassium-transporting ATPase subunit KdpC [Polyangiaceae bacterium]|nr:potassium-transporting ATPase subunit KdpC [Polyangiaceae bacterium]
MLSVIRPALVLLAAFTLLCGLVYPAAVTGVAQMAFSEKANGSLIRKEDRVLGSSLIGQPFTAPGYFWGRPSGTAPFANNAGASSGTNQGPLNPALQEAVNARIEALRAADPGNDRPVPVDLVTASASGLDPHISPAAAQYQIGRVARARGLDPAELRTLVDRHTQPRLLGLLGERCVNVLELNLALDQLLGSPPAPSAAPVMRAGLGGGV